MDGIQALDRLVGTVMQGVRVSAVQLGGNMTLGVEVLGPDNGWPQGDWVRLRLSVSAFGVRGQAETGDIQRAFDEDASQEGLFLFGVLRNLFGEIQDGFIIARDEFDQVDLSL